MALPVFTLRFRKLRKQILTICFSSYKELHLVFQQNVSKQFKSWSDSYFRWTLGACLCLMHASFIQWVTLQPDHSSHQMSKAPEPNMLYNIVHLQHWLKKKENESCCQLFSSCHKRQFWILTHKFQDVHKFSNQQHKKQANKQKHTHYFVSSSLSGYVPLLFQEFGMWGLVKVWPNNVHNCYRLQPEAISKEADLKGSCPCSQQHWILNGLCTPAHTQQQSLPHLPQCLQQWITQGLVVWFFQTRHFNKSNR